MFKTCFVFNTFFCIFILINSAHAVEVKDLYVAKINVASQSTAERDEALKLAMRSILIKVAGHKSFNQASKNQEKTLTKAFKRVKNYITQYRYERKNNASVLIATFDEAKINSLISEVEFPLWGRLRPQMLLWIIKEDGLKRQLLSESSTTSIPDLAQEYSNSLGLPLMVPLMDLTDLTQLSVADLWGRFAQPVKAASQRYLADDIVIIRLSNSSLLPQDENQDNCQLLLCAQSNFALDWTLISNGRQGIPQEYSALYRGQNSNELVQDALSDITQIIYQRYALSTSTSNDFSLDVANINSLSSYLNVSAFLEQLSSVKSVKLIFAKGKVKRFQLNLIGSQQALLASLKLNKQLKQYIDPLADVDENAVPVFYWEKQRGGK